MAKIYASAVVFKFEGDEFDATEALIDALTRTGAVDVRFVGGAVRVPDTGDEYDSETVGPYIAGIKKLAA